MNGIKSISIDIRTLHFKEPFSTSYETVDKTDVLFLTLKDRKGNVGYGCASEDTGVTKETVREVAKILEKKLIKDFFDTPLDHWYSYHEKIQKIFSSYPLAQMAIEEAVLNRFCNEKKIFLHQLLGGYRDEVPTAITIGVKSYEESMSELKKRLMQGFRVIKLKIGRDLEEDIYKISRFNSTLTPKHRLILDPNRGYKFKDALFLLNKIDRMQSVALIEQPLEVEEKNKLRALRIRTKIPIIADELATDVQTSIKLIEDDVVDGINSKLMKCGGVLNFIKIFNTVKNHNKIMMIGCTYESNLSITTGASLALALPIDYVDLDSGTVDFTDDPVHGGVKIIDGMLHVNSKPVYDKKR